VLGCVGVSSADVFVLQGFELLLCAEFVGLEERSISIHRHMRLVCACRFLTML
jgi:hypothetical protein